MTEDKTYWPAKCEFWIWYSSIEELYEKMERMKKIANERRVEE